MYTHMKLWLKRVKKTCLYRSEHYIACVKLCWNFSIIQKIPFLVVLYGPSPKKGRYKKCIYYQSIMQMKLMNIIYLKLK